MAATKAGQTPAPAHLGDHGRKEADRKLGETEAAKRAIERDYETYGGVYPYANGKVTIAEVLRRAGLSPTALEKPRHSANKAALRTWVEGVEKAKVSGIKVIRRAVTAKAEGAKDELRNLMQRWSIAELEHADCQAELFKARRTIAALEARIADLQEQVLALQADLAGGKVVRIAKSKVNS